MLQLVFNISSFNIVLFIIKELNQLKIHYYFDLDFIRCNKPLDNLHEKI